MPDKNSLSHSQIHTDQEFHHHHLHASNSHHEHGAHLLQVEHLSVAFEMYDEDASFFQAKKRMVNVISDVNIAVHAGEIVAVVGASGSGKSLLADTILGIYEPNAQVSGTIWYEGTEQDARSLSQLRGHGISLVPQGVASLDPLMCVGKQVEGFGHPQSARQARKKRRRELFSRYGLEESVASLYPHQLSGGMARRILLCCALMDNPRLIVADEPTPGLDLELAEQALSDFRDFANQGGGVMLITHDIELALHVADRVAVFYEGSIVEETAVSAFASPELLEHEYSRALWHALPEHDFVGEAHISA